ncbi:MAG: hypothetical protein L6425_07940 [Candidatus Aminicenantes bacterium]|nr:hypothetical protein [Candidatus Aminicenantes bacterium]
MSEIAYLSHLEEKTAGLHSGLASIGCGEFSPEIMATPLDGGYRNRIKIKIFHGPSPIRFVGMDPLEGNDLVFLNPPRSGCSSEVLDPLIESRPGLICMISCFPETQLRDLRLLLDAGYKLLSLSAFDMFPFSDYLETLAILGSGRDIIHQGGCRQGGRP